MSNSRKVQADIDRLLKKTNEGIEAYEELFNKFANAPNPNAKERLEGDLKKEIKKLQRHREQIKSLIASAEVKDTKALESYRKRIEDKMEAFKTCEREMKTKAFSKEGLASAANELYESPLAQMETWLKGAIEEARKKIELLEYDVVRMNNTMRATRKNKQQQQQKSDVVVQLEKMQIHFHKWEALLRMVTNEEITRDEFDELQPAIEKVLQDDVDMAVLSDMSIYADYDIPDPKLKLPVNDDDVAVAANSNSSAAAAEERRGAQGGNNNNNNNSKNASTSNTVATSSVAAVKKTPPPLPAAGASRGSNHATPGTLDNSNRNSKPSTRTTPDEDAATGNKSQHHAAATATAASTPSSTTAAAPPPSSSSPQQQPPPPQQPRRSSGNSAAVPVIEDDNDTAPEWLDDEMDNVNDDTFGDAATAAVLGAAAGGAGAVAAAGGGGFSLADMANNTSKALGEWERQRTQSRGGNSGSKATSPSSQPPPPLSPPQQQRPMSSSADGGSGNNNGNRAAAATTTTNEWERRKLELLKGKSPSAGSAAGAGEASAGAAAVAANTATGTAATASSSLSPSAQLQPQREGATSTASTASTSPMPSQHAQQQQQQQQQAHAGSVATALPRDRAHTSRYDMATTLSLLDMSLANLPHTLDVERQRPYEPPNAIEPIAYFPQEVHPVLSNREIYHNFDLDTLFFIFYYHQKSYQQYFAAKELKAHSFRYHAEQRRWYLRREKPRETSATSERGSYTYFDFEDTWEKQTVDDFVFEYKYLEDDLV